MDLREFGCTHKRGAGSSSSPHGSPFKKHVPDPGRTQVKIKGDRYAVAAKWQFGAEKLKGDLMNVRVSGYSNGLVWNVPRLSYMNAERHSEPPVMQLTCPSRDFLGALCRACEASQWCSHWFITGKNGESIPCSAQDIDTLQVDFDLPANPREEAESNCDDLREDARAVMKVARSSLEVMNILMPRVPPSSSRDMRAL